MTPGLDSPVLKRIDSLGKQAFLQGALAKLRATPGFQQFLSGIKGVPTESPNFARSLGGVARPIYQIPETESFRRFSAGVHGKADLPEDLLYSLGKITAPAYRQPAAVTGVLGSLAGASTSEDYPALGALIGGALGASTPGTFKYLKRHLIN